MIKARGLLKLVWPYLQEMETDFPRVGAGFLVVITEGVFHAIRDEKIFLRTSKDKENMPYLTVYKNYSWVARAASGNVSAGNNSKRRPLTKPTPLQGQSHEDRRVMIRLKHDHEARKTELCLLRQRSQRV